MADLTLAVAQSHTLAPHQTGASRKLRTLGGAGSGNFGHAGGEGGPGNPGGSTSSKARTYNDARAALQDALGPREDGAPHPVGVDDHPVAIRAALEVAPVLAEMHAKGYTMPRQVNISADARTAVSGQVFVGNDLVIRVPRFLTSEMALDTAVALTYGVGTTEAGVQKYAARTFKDVVVHEMGHVNTTPSNTPERAADWQHAVETLGLPLMKTAADQVSDYAWNSTHEYVAEAFTKLYRGETLPPEAMTVYAAFGGAPIR